MPEASEEGLAKSPCKLCGAWVSKIKAGAQAGRPYNDDGTWHEDTCEPDAEYQKKERLRSSNWAAKHLVKGDDRKEFRSKTPISKKVKRTPIPRIK